MSFPKGHRPYREGKILICLNCRKEFHTGRKHGGIKYCSRNCWKQHWKGANTYMWGKHPVLSEQGRTNIVIAMNGNKYRVGLKPWNWKEDRTQLKKKQERNDYPYQEWRRQVFERDNWKCHMRNSDCSGKIIAHHILSWSQFPELRYEVNNGITLCEFHHPRKRVEEIKLAPLFQEILGMSLVAPMSNY